MTNAKTVFIGEVAQIAGVASMVGGVVLSLRHWPAAAALIGGSPGVRLTLRSFGTQTARPSG